MHRPSVPSRFGSKLPLPHYADVRLHIPMAPRNDVIRYDKYGTPIPEAMRRDWWQLSSYLECREIRQLSSWGEPIRLDTPLQQSTSFVKLMQIEDKLWGGIPWSRRTFTLVVRARARVCVCVLRRIFILFEDPD